MTEYVRVRTDSVEWLKKHYPARCEKSGMCERVAGRLYTRTALQDAPTNPESLAFHLHNTEYPENGYSLAEFRKDDDYDFFTRIARATMQVAPKAAPTNPELSDLADNFKSQRQHGGNTFDEFDFIGFARDLLARYAPAQDIGFSVGDMDLFVSTYGHFDEGVGTCTTTDVADLMRFARAGLLECVHFTVTAKGEAMYADRALKSTSAGKE